MSGKWRPSCLSLNVLNAPQWTPKTIQQSGLSKGVFISQNLKCFLFEKMSQAGQFCYLKINIW